MPGRQLSGGNAIWSATYLRVRLWNRRGGNDTTNMTLLLDSKEKWRQIQR